MKTIKDIVFIDIETVSCAQHLQELSTESQQLWLNKSAFIRNTEDQTAQELYPERAAIYAEFGKVVCISIGYCLLDDSKTINLRVKSVYNEDEKALLTEFCELIERKFDSRKVKLCAHNGKEFDFPYLARRLIVNGIKLPVFLDISGKKPWEIKHIDTMEMWKFGDRKSYTSLDLLTNVLDLPSPKTEMDGSMVGRVYYEQNDLEKIGSYCAEDVVATVQVFLKFKGIAAIPRENIHILV